MLGNIGKVSFSVWREWLKKKSPILGNNVKGHFMIIFFYIHELPNLLKIFFYYKITKDTKL